MSDLPPVTESSDSDPYITDPITQIQGLIKVGDLELASQLIQPILKEMEYSEGTPSQAVLDILETLVLHDAQKYGVK